MICRNKIEMGKQKFMTPPTAFAERDTQGVYPRDMLLIEKLEARFEIKLFLDQLLAFWNQRLKRQSGKIGDKKSNWSTFFAETFRMRRIDQNISSRLNKKGKRLKPKTEYWNS